jgi:hypothetical protein
MGPIRSSLVLSAAALIGAFSSVTPALQAAEPTEDKGAKIYCYMRSSGNDHKVSWNAAYAVIKRQSRSMFKTSPEHASVMITEVVVNDPGNFPDCGQFLGDLFGGNTQPATATTLGKSSTISESTIESTDDTTRYSY